MSRVDDARRRAADLASDGVANLTRSEDLKPLPLDTSRVTLEAFPVETIEPAGPRKVRALLSRSSRPLPASMFAAERATGIRPLDRAALPSLSSPGWDPVPAALSHKIVGDPNLSPAACEQYRLLAATLHNAQMSHGVKVILIASAVAGEGKTLTAANLALTFSEAYERAVLLVDADLRRPSLHLLFTGKLSAPTVSSTSDGETKTRIRQVRPLLAVLTTESPSSVPMADLTSGEMQRVIQDGRETFDWIIIDSPPVTLLPDASLLASIVDGAVLVTKAAATPLDAVQRAVAAIGRTKMLGIVLNAAAQPRGGRAEYADYYSRVDASDAAPRR
jgi:protein-tyrosine kinase